MHSFQRHLSCAPNLATFQSVSAESIYHQLGPSDPSATIPRVQGKLQEEGQLLSKIVKKRGNDDVMIKVPAMGCAFKDAVLCSRVCMLAAGSNLLVSTPATRQCRSAFA